MADRYQSLTGTPIGKLLVKNLGLPNPTPLASIRRGRRRSSTAPSWSAGPARLRAQAAAAISAGRWRGRRTAR